MEDSDCLSDIYSFEDEEPIFLPDVSKRIPSDVTSYPSRPESSRFYCPPQVLKPPKMCVIRKLNTKLCVKEIHNDVFKERSSFDEGNVTVCYRSASHFCGCS